MKILFVFFASFLTSASSSLFAATPHKSPEVRGTWLTTTANTAIASPGATAATTERLREIGFNTVYVEVWKNGYTQFPSPTLDQVIGRDRTPSLGKRDLLEETLIQAHRNRLLYFAWFEYGFMAAHQNTRNSLRRMKPEWLSEDINGNTVAPNGFVWMNPLHPEVQSFLIDLMLDAIRSYDLDGVQLDDRLAWPYHTMGYDAYTRSVYAAEHEGRQPPKDSQDPEWLRWRANKVTEFARRLHLELHREKPDLILSISPGPYPWSYDNYACDWPAWVEEDLFDEFIPQVYRTDFAAFKSEWQRQVGVMGDRQKDLLAGIRIVGTGPDTTWSDLKAKIELTRASEAGGHVLWFSRGVLDLYPTELKTFYHGESVPHPRRDAGWRPAPIQCLQSADSKDIWTAEVETGGYYRTVVRRGKTWKEIESRFHSPGEASLQVAGADQVELLVDRRKQK